MKKVETRTVDELGGIILPVEMRKSLNINTGDSLDITVHTSAMIIEKHEPSCLLCSAKTNLKQINENFFFCKGCINELSNI